MSFTGLYGKELEGLHEALRSFGHHRFPALREEVDDLAAQTLSDVWSYLGGLQGATPLARDEVRKLAFTVFRRRAADLFRRRAQQPLLSMEEVPDAVQTVAEEGPGKERALLYRRMLRICLAEMAGVNEEDRLLLARVADLDSAYVAADHEALAPRERQRLRRLRLRLAEAIRREMGEDARQLLREDF
ncbi:hypothetical protein [Massilia sp. erpn]|uniref:hypothetical protein n=1 Tax=Massilia sp. erpn TaxID=2738142 RepID=UPI0021020D31|nr:hypothetical protein [Massilia sp. erpn]UTY58323.1 hypothetical protein HPQ68_14720 [Massilia sp. erpn]